MDQSSELKNILKFEKFFRLEKLKELGIFDTLRELSRLEKFLWAEKALQN